MIGFANSSPKILAVLSYTVLPTVFILGSFTVVRLSGTRFVPAALGRDGARLATCLYRLGRRSGLGEVRRVPQQVGLPLSGDWEAATIEMERVLAVSRLGRGDPPRDLHDERDRVAQPPLPARGLRLRTLPERHRGAEMPLPRHPIACPDRQGKGTPDQQMEAAIKAFAVAFEGRID